MRNCQALFVSFDRIRITLYKENFPDFPLPQGCFYGMPGLKSHPVWMAG
jgi:hypothetical protein